MAMPYLSSYLARREDEPAYAEAMKRVEQSLDREMSQRV
jgi:hypothetical protein